MEHRIKRLLEHNGIKTSDNVYNDLVYAFNLDDPEADTEITDIQDIDLKNTNSKLAMLNYDQKDAVDKIKDWIKSDDPYFILRGYAGSGKEQPIRCKVQTPNGPVKLKDLNIGDKIFGSNGKPTTVTGIFPQGVKMSYKVSFKDGTHTYCGIDHLWYITDKKGKSKVVNTKFLLERNLKNSAGYKFRIPLCKPVEYEKRNLKIHPYFMGVLLGDGCFKKTPQLTIGLKDIEIFDTIKKDKRFKYSVRDGKGCIQINICRKNKENLLTKYLKYYKLYGLKSVDKFIPIDYLYSSVEDRLWLLRGLMDTDGSCGKKGRIRFCSYSYSLKKGVTQLVQSLGGYTVDYGEDLSIRTFQNPFFIKRKADNWYFPTQNIPVKSIVSVKPHKMEKQLCINVKAKNNLYLTDNYIVTHNTFLISALSEIFDNIIYSSPTNKASSVLASMLNKKVKTTYSILGLRMVHEEDEVRLEPNPNFIGIETNSLLIVDEASMVGELLYDAIDRARLVYNLKVLFVGDPAQIPPVGEPKTLAWSATKKKEHRHMLKTIVRYDSVLLDIATSIRNSIIQKEPIDLHLIYNNLESISEHQLYEMDFSEFRIIAWRNVVVDSINEIVRRFKGYKKEFEIGDIVMLKEPMEFNGIIIAHKDEEFTITDIEDGYVNTLDEQESKIPVYVVKTDKNINLNIPRGTLFNSYANDLAIYAKKQTNKSNRREAWKAFWEFKAKFQEVRYAYCLTAHRSQGSTFKKIAVVFNDIMINSNKKEAMRCLYVAFTRASDEAFIWEK